MFHKGEACLRPIVDVEALAVVCPLVLRPETARRQQAVLDGVEVVLFVVVVRRDIVVSIHHAVEAVRRASVDAEQRGSAYDSRKKPSVACRQSIRCVSVFAE